MGKRKRDMDEPVNTDLEFDQAVDRLLNDPEIDHVDGDDDDDDQGAEDT